MSISWQLVGACTLPNIGGWCGGYFVKKNFGWYQALKKPSWNPPAQVFGPIWTALYTSMGYASYLVWKEVGFHDPRACVPFTLYGTQLVLNWLWTPIWFGCRSLKWGMIEGLIMAGTAVACTAKFYAINPMAGYLMLPYLAWLGVASSLMVNLYCNNSDEKDPSINKCILYEF